MGVKIQTPPLPKTFYASPKPAPYHVERASVRSIVTETQLLRVSEVERVKGGARRPDGHHAQCQT